VSQTGLLKTQLCVKVHQNLAECTASIYRNKKCVEGHSSSPGPLIECGEGPPPRTPIPRGPTVPSPTFQTKCEDSYGGKQQRIQIGSTLLQERHPKGT